MEALIHLFIEVIKVTILTIVYTFVLMKLLEVISKKNPELRIYHYLKNKTIHRAMRNIMGMVIFIGLTIWMFSFWGNHGFGDSARIPVGNKVEIKNINWTKYGFIGIDQKNSPVDIETTKFKISGKKIVGNLDSGFHVYENKYFIFDTEDRSLLEFKTVEAFDAHTQNNNLPHSNELLTFRSNYENYWHGWRFFLLP